MDAFGNLTRVDETDPQRGPVYTAYAYDVLNHLTNVTMPRGATQTRTFNYNAGNDVTACLQSATNPDNGTVTYSYNADGALASKTDAKGQKIVYQYDPYGRLLLVGTPYPPDGNGNPVPPTPIRIYTYETNSADPNYSANAWSRLTTVQYNIPAMWTAWDESGEEVQYTVQGYTATEMYNYTQAGLLTGKRLRLVTGADDKGRTASDDVDASWTYDNEGRVTGITYPADAAMIAQGPAPDTYAYNGLGPSGMSDNNNNNASVVGGVVCKAAGQFTQMGAETRSYNTLG